MEQGNKVNPLPLPLKNDEKPSEICDPPGHLGVSWWSKQYGILSDVYAGLHLQGHETLEANGSVQF